MNALKPVLCFVVLIAMERKNAWPQDYEGWRTRKRNKMNDSAANLFEPATYERLHKLRKTNQIDKVNWKWTLLFFLLQFVALPKLHCFLANAEGKGRMFDLQNNNVKVNTKRTRKSDRMCPHQKRRNRWKKYSESDFVRICCFLCLNFLQNLQNEQRKAKSRFPGEDNERKKDWKIL